METSASEAYKTTVLRNFIAKDGTLRSIPAQYKKKLVILEYLVERLEAGRNIRKRISMRLSSVIMRIMRPFGGIYHSSIYEP